MKKIGDKTKDEIQTLVKYDDYYYTHEKAKYIPTPSKNSNSYNCNSFAHGLLKAANIRCSKPDHKVPGWDKPLPSKYFGVVLNEENK